MRIRLIDFGYEKAPERQFHNDAGADVRSMVNMLIGPGESRKVPLGFGLDLPDGQMALMMPRSGLASKGIVAHVAPADSGYKGELHAIVTNNNIHNTFKIRKGDRIAQLVVIPILTPDFVEETGKERGTGAFGSTGVE